MIFSEKTNFRISITISNIALLKMHKYIICYRYSKVCFSCNGNLLTSIMEHDRRMVSVLLKEKERIYYDIVLESYFGCILIGQSVSMVFGF